jgi:hypothetical protein
MFNEYDVVRLRRQIPECGLAEGQIGTVVLVYGDPPEAYEVEFTDGDAHTVALLTLDEQDLEKAAS